MPPPQPHLLTLPLELRHRIYSFLLPPIPTSHPLPSVGLTAVSHRLPSASTLNIHPQISDEILEYYYTITTWKIIFSHAYNLFRVDPYLKGLERSATLDRLRKVEIVFYCDVLLLGDYNHRSSRGGSGGGGGEGVSAMKKFCDEIRKRADRACDVLLQAAKLRTVIVSWIDTTGCRTSSDTFAGEVEDSWTRKCNILTPLRKLLRHPGGKISIEVGHVNGMARGSFVKAIEDTLGVRRERKDSGVGLSSSEAGDDTEQASKLRMLAFDPRQDRHLYHREQEEALYWGSMAK